MVFKAFNSLDHMSVFSEMDVSNIIFLSIGFYK